MHHTPQWNRWIFKPANVILKVFNYSGNVNPNLTVIRLLELQGLTWSHIVFGPIIWDRSKSRLLTAHARICGRSCTKRKELLWAYPYGEQHRLRPKGGWSRIRQTVKKLLIHPLMWLPALILSPAWDGPTLTKLRFSRTVRYAFG